MEDEYVKKSYKGKVLTDFDETVSHFDDAPFSLKKVMTLEARENNAIDILKESGIHYNEIFKYQTEVKHLLQVKDIESKNQNKVFISYNHADQEIAFRIKALLESEGINVIIDSEAMVTGEKIEAFIEDCIRTSGITLAIVSKKSLISA